MVGPAPEDLGLAPQAQPPQSTYMGGPVPQHLQNSTLEPMDDTDKRRDRSRRLWLESSSDSTLLGRAMSLKRRFASSSTSSYSSRLSSSQHQRMRRRSSISRASMCRVSAVAASGVSRKAGVSFAGSLPSFASSSSSTSSKRRSCSLIPEPSSTAAAELLEHGVFRDVCSTLAALDDATLLDKARKARRKLESVSKRQAMVGKWKRRSAGSPNCQVFDYKTKRRDQYSVVAKINLRCSLREIMSVLSTDHSTEFHRAMVALFGDQYVFGMNVKTMDCTAQANRRSANSSRRRTHSHASRHSSASNGGSKSVRTAKLALNTVSLLRKHHLLWKQQSLSFVDYLEEKVDAKSVTRVLQTLDEDEDEDDGGETNEQNLTNFLEGSEMGLAVSRAEPTATMTSPSPLALELKGILAGYVIQEDSEEQFTRLFFYATHRTPSKAKAKISSQAVQILRDMATTVSKLEAVVLRRRFGSYPIIAPPTSVSVWESTKACKSCCVPFNLLRKRHFCSLCGHYTCRKCSGVEDVEKTLGFIDRRRICVACVRRVGYCVFTVGGGTFVPKHNSSQTTFLMDRFEEAYENPPMLAADENDEMEQAMVSPLPQQSTDRPMSRRKRADHSVQQLRLSLSYNSDEWHIHSDWREATTPKESICLLDSWATQSLTSASASRAEDRLLQSHHSA